MGSNSSISCQQLVICIDHPKFKNARIVTYGLDSRLVTTLQIEEALFKSWQKILTAYGIHSQFAFLPIECKFSQSSYCSMKGNVEIAYDNFPYLLKNQIHDRFGKNQPFTEEQLWLLMLAIFSVKNQFSNLKINQGILGSISPENVFLAQKGLIKIGNCLSWPTIRQLKEKNCLLSNQQFISPQDFAELQIGLSYNLASENSQMFAIGLTVLSAAILKEEFNPSNLKLKQFNFNQVSIRIQHLRLLTRYSDSLKAVIQLMCSFDAKDRLTTHQISGILFKYNRSIKQKRNFAFPPGCQKIQNKLIEYRNLQKGKQKPPSLIQLNQVYSNQQQLQNIQNRQSNQPQRKSLNLTQVIFNHHPPLYEQRSSHNSQSLRLSEQFIPIKKTKSQQEKQKPLLHYQIINSNRYRKSIEQMESLSFFNMTKQEIVQKPVIIDAKRKSDDIEEEVTPCNTPVQTSNTIKTHQKNKEINRSQHISKSYLNGSLNIVFGEKNQLSKTTTFDSKRNASFPTPIEIS